MTRPPKAKSGSKAVIARTRSTRERGQVHFSEVPRVSGNFFIKNNEKRNPRPKMESPQVKFKLRNEEVTSEPETSVDSLMYWEENAYDVPRVLKAPETNRTRKSIRNKSAPVSSVLRVGPTTSTEKDGLPPQVTNKSKRPVLVGLS